MLSPQTFILSYIMNNYISNFSQFLITLSIINPHTKKIETFIINHLSFTLCKQAGPVAFILELFKGQFFKRQTSKKSLNCRCFAKTSVHFENSKKFLNYHGFQ